MPTIDEQPPVVEVKNLTREYRVQKNALAGGRFGLGLLRREMETITAIDGISFSVNAGEAVGLVGLNGAGKSTLLKLITGVLVPTRGEVLVGGLDPSKNRSQVVRNIGVVFGHRSQLWWDAPLSDSMNVLKLIYSVGDDVYAERLRTLSEILELEPLLSRAPRQLSLGQRVRGEILASLLHKPDLLILDEPTVGLDILAKSRIRKLIRTLVEEEQMAVILASHEVTDIEEVCERTILIDHGKILYEGTIEDLVASARVERSLVLDVASEDDGDVEVRRVTVPLSGEDAARQLIEAASNGTVTDARVTGGDLEVILARLFDQSADG